MRVAQLLDAVEHHLAVEAQTLGRYAYLAAHAGDPAVALVMRLVLADEERHHRLLQQLSTSLRHAVAQDAPDLAHTRKQIPPTAPLAELTRLAHELATEERAGAESLRELATATARPDELECVLLEMMAADSDKHARLIDFVESRLRQTERAGVAAK
jgi:rubrerythrin